MSLAAALKQIADQLNADLPYLRASVVDPPAQISQFPVTVVYATGPTRYSNKPLGSLTEHHTVTIDVIRRSVDVTHTLAKFDETARDVPNCFFRRFRDRTFTAFDSLSDEVTCQLVTREWGGTTVLINRYTANIKVIGLLA